jgi:aspartokinase
MPELLWLDNYSGETTDELLAMEGRYRTDSLVLIFEQAIGQKAAREGDQSLSSEERVVLAIEALEREVNNGGYEQFFLNSSREYASIIVDALVSIGSRRTAAITQKAIDALRCQALTSEAIESAMLAESEDRDQSLFVCDNQYFARREDIEGHLLAFIKTNKDKVRL